MQIKSVEQQFSMRHRVERIAGSVDDINARIVRLADMLNIDLDSETDRQRVYRLDGMDETNFYRQVRMQELRALLVMRYGMIRHCATFLGAAATRSLFIGDEEQAAGNNPSAESACGDVRLLFGLA